jgi:alpha-glucosidase
MTYASFTRPVWAWLSEPGPISWFFGLPYPVMPQYSGHQVAEANTRFTAAMPWRSRLNSMNALDTHDTSRFVTRARPGAVPVALGLSLTLPGIPVVFAGDEFGFTGENGEHSRTPIPWDRVDDYAPTIDLYAAHLRLRREHPALATGSLRWLHVGDDALVFVRELERETVLVLAARDDADIALDGIDASTAVRLIGDADLRVDARADSRADATVASGVAARIQSTGMTFTVWALPGIDTPAFPGHGVPAAADSPQWSVVSRSDA